MVTERTTCVVAGGGPAGMVLGLLLARAGVQVTVLEKHGDFLRDFRGDTVHASTLALLDELGLADAFEQLPYSKVEQFQFPGPDGNLVTLGDFDSLPGKYQYIAMVPQWDLLDLLANASAIEPTFALRMNTEVTGVTRERGRVTGVTYRTADGQTGELYADLVVAADGRWSVLRDAAGLRPHEYQVPIDTWWVRLPRHASEDRGAIRAIMRGTELALTIDRDDYYQLAYFNRKGFDPTLRAQGVERFRERIATLLPALADRVDAIASMDDVKFLEVRLNRLPRWYVDGLLCIGDAAHAMSPAGGVGINLAIQDAVAAATLLAEPLRRHVVRTADLARVQRRRWLPTVIIQGVQRILHAVMLKPVVEGRPARRPPLPVQLIRRFPMLRRLPTYLIGIGPRPEHAPGFARPGGKPDLDGYAWLAG
jgi:2-polyprenyl-6-methoxyphenol hydroxylase-like FAD-dependent oxidoreductase